MNDINLLLRALTKGEMVDIIQRFSIQVTGFAIHVEKAPIPLLLASLKKEIETGLRKRRNRGKKYTEFEEICKFLASRYLPVINEGNYDSLEEVAELFKFERLYSKASMLAILYLHFQEIYMENLATLEDNIKNDVFILNGIIEEISLEDKLTRFNEKLLRSDSYEQELNNIKEIIREEIGEEEYEEIKEKVNKNGNESFFRMIHVTGKGKHYVPMIPFLLEEKRYTNNKYAPLLAKVLLEIIKQRKIIEKDTNKTLDDTRETLVKVTGILKKEQENYSYLKKEHAVLKQRNNEMQINLSELSQELLKQKQHLEKSSEQFDELKTVVAFIKHLLKEKQVILVSNETHLLENVLFGDFVIDVETLNYHIKKKDTRLFDDKVLCITRVSYPNTEKWRKHSNYLKQQMIQYCELSGYVIEEYIPQMLEFLYKREREVKW
ncbi:hypothetical protein ACLM5H_19420 [Fredinandcohnia humi]